MAEMSVGGEVAVDYAPSGLVWRLACPLDRVIEGPLAPGAGRAAVPLGPPSLGRRPGSRRVLVVEDEPLIAIEMAAVLEAAGFEVVGPAASVGEALALLDARAATPPCST